MVEKSGVEKFMVENSGVENFHLALGLKSPGLKNPCLKSLATLFHTVKSRIKKIIGLPEKSTFNSRIEIILSGIVSPGTLLQLS